jgi:hypothetical protein
MIPALSITGVVLPQRISRSLSFGTGPLPVGADVFDCGGILRGSMKSKESGLSQ